VAGLKKHKTIRQALQYVADHPGWPSDDFHDRIEMPVWEMVSRNLFDIANLTDTSTRAGFARSTRAQRIILDRLTGTRRTGTNPAVRRDKAVKLLDLGAGYSEGSDDESRS